MTKRKTLTSTFYNTTPTHRREVAVKADLSARTVDFCFEDFDGDDDDARYITIEAARALVDDVISAINLLENRDSKRKALLAAMSDEDLQILGLSRE